MWLDSRRLELLGCLGIALLFFFLLFAKRMEWERCRGIVHRWARQNGYTLHAFRSAHLFEAPDCFSFRSTNGRWFRVTLADKNGDFSRLASHGSATGFGVPSRVEASRCALTTRLLRDFLSCRQPGHHSRMIRAARGR